MYDVIGIHGICYMKQLTLAAAVIIISSICALVSSVAIAFLLDHTGHALSWFSNTYLLFGLYVAPACCIMLSVCVLAKKYFYKVIDYISVFAVGHWHQSVIKSYHLSSGLQDKAQDKTKHLSILSIFKEN